MSALRKTIFITGAGSGIGRATAQLFAQRGWFVGLYDVNPSGLAETETGIPATQRISGVFDVRDRAGWKTALDQFTAATDGKLHVLFNNAGLARHGWFEDVSQDDADLEIDVNIKGVVNGCYAALPYLKAMQGSRIVNTASAAAIIGSPRLSVYSATKFAVRGLSEALDIEFGRHGVRVTCLMPFFIETPILDGGTSGTNRHFRDEIVEQKSKVYPVSDAAEGAWAAAHGTELHYPVGAEAKRAHMLARFIPKTIRRQIAAQLGVK
ncbi:MAG: SDR family oxidoreductase [Alphaproteobacteria bacterium]|nr:SDR family oxidoreductase [Alphaproteobacteria bacterium]